MPDADMLRFNRDLKDTPAGLRLRLAFSEARIALQNISKMRATYGLAALDRAGTPYAKTQAWRRQYVRACESASEAIDQLWREHRWPDDGAYERSFMWRPTDSV